jgi:hypothetical protein
MAADIKFRLLADDSLADSPHLLSPQTLYAGMATYVEYHELYAKNEGSVLNNPAHSHRYSSGSYSLYTLRKRKVTGSAENAVGGNGDDSGDNSGTVMIAYGSAYNCAVELGPTALNDPAYPTTWPANRCYDLWTSYKVGSGAGALVMYHLIGGNEP